ncbi:MAG: DNA polymerase III subunit delta [Spirochaetia bacterium]
MSNTPTVYLFTGPEEGEKRQHIKKLLKQFSQEWKEKPEIYNYHAHEKSIQEVVMTLENNMLFASHIVVILQNADALKQDEIKRIKEYRKRKQDASKLILVSSEMRVSQSLEKVIDPSAKKIFWELREPQKHGWISRYFQNNGKSISSRAVDFILSMVENDTSSFENICSRLISFYTDKQQLEEADVEEYLYHSKEENVFSLFHAMAGKQMEQSLSIYKNIVLSKESAVQSLVSSLLYQFKKLHMVLQLKRHQYNSQEIFKTLNIWSKKAQSSFLLAAEHYSIEDTQQIIKNISNTLEFFRTSSADIHMFAAEYFLYSCIKSPAVAVFIDRKGYSLYSPEFQEAIF